VGAIIIGSRTWQRIPDAIKPDHLAAVAEVDQRLYDETAALEAEAMRVMKKEGLRVNEVSPQETKVWETEMSRGFDLIVGRSFSRETYDLVVGHLEDFRSR
jgi:TRAP-type C4-dicarboxylate transport system substrate-binding protein